MAMVSPSLKGTPLWRGHQPADAGVSEGGDGESDFTSAGKTAKMELAVGRGGKCCP